MSEPISRALDVLVVGAGPTGLVMAAELARRGVSCRIVDKAAQPTEQSRAIGIQARTLELFDNMGIVEEFTSRGLKGRIFTIVSDGHEIVRLSFDELDSAYPYLLLLPQNETERILTQHLNRLGVMIERNVELTGLQQDANGVTASLRNNENGENETLNARWLIGCDGAHSVTRHLLDIPFAGTTDNDRFLLADLHIDWNRPDEELHLYTHETGLLAIFALGNGRFRVIADNPPQADAEQSEPTLEDCQALMKQRGAENAIVSNPNWMAYFRVSYRIAARFREGNAFLAGDAANIHSPAGAQGMNTGIQDAFNLAWKIALVAQGKCDSALLDSYQEERYPVEKAVQVESHVALQIASLHRPLARHLRDRIAPILTGLEVVQQRIRRTIAELAVNYRHSSIVENHLVSSDVAAGDRVPDASLVCADSRASERLYEILRDNRHTLLLWGGEKPSLEDFERLDRICHSVRDGYGSLVQIHLLLEGEHLPDGLCWNGSVLLEAAHALHKHYGRHAGLYLVRPDGYVGFRSLADTGERLLTYLVKTFFPSA